MIKSEPQYGYFNNLKLEMLHQFKKRKKEFGLLHLCLTRFGNIPLFNKRMATLYAAQTIAEYILWVRQDQKTTPMHILKLVYLCHGWYLGWTGKPLIKDRVEAWLYRPVIPALYSRYKIFGGEAIEEKGVDHSGDLEELDRKLIHVVLDYYKKTSPLQLSSLTHIDGSPWQKTVDRFGPGKRIPNEFIREYYQRRAAKSIANSS